MTFVRPEIALSISSLHFWLGRFPFLPRAEALLRALCRPGLELDGVEIYLSHANAAALAAGTAIAPDGFFYLSPDLRKRLLSLTANSIHLESLAALPLGAEEEFAAVLETLRHDWGIREFTIHPDGVPYSRWERLLAALSRDIVLSVENMDVRKSEYRTLAEIDALLEAFPGLSMTFDLAHWLEHGRAADDPELLEFLDRRHARISKIHFSVPSSRVAAYGRLPTFHCCATWSGHRLPAQFFAAVPRHARWVIEGLIPTDAGLLLKEEISLLRLMTGDESSAVWKAV